MSFDFILQRKRGGSTSVGLRCMSFDLLQLFHIGCVDLARSENIITREGRKALTALPPAWCHMLLLLGCEQISYSAASTVHSHHVLG